MSWVFKSFQIPFSGKSRPKCFIFSLFKVFDNFVKLLVKTWTIFLLLNINFEVHFSLMSQLIHFYAEITLFVCSFARFHLFQSAKNIFWGQDWAWVRLQQELKVLNLFFFFVLFEYLLIIPRRRRGENFFFKSYPLLYDLKWYNSCKATSLIDRERERIREEIQYRE